MTTGQATDPALREGASVGELLRAWRLRRKFSQLELSLRAGVSTRHLSFIETGRSKPTSTMIDTLATSLELALRERNRLLLAGGYAPRYTERALDEPGMDAIRAGIRQVLRGHEPYPAVLVDSDWNLVEANATVSLFTVDAAEHLLEPPLNVLRLSLHPDGMAPRILGTRGVPRREIGTRHVARRSAGRPATVPLGRGGGAVREHHDGVR
ncbi:helix-turn-helix domain-containing protein [Haloechinothrix sp. LS1_15]|uniref:helix-turn-helix domain-containing protein n=1 Tax=Haloechinothrix sp. LS1_15 TaxID=2652248 RepID=UPI00294B35DE|nr:helix-turn-helix domain-containing protein [Haloechinothrix sp. LS1_15]